MNQPMKSISDTELDVLKALWELERATIRELQDHFLKDGRSWAYTTVQTLVMRLEEKGYAVCDKSERAHMFQAAISRGAHVEAQVDDLVERVCDGKASPLVLSLVERTKFSKGDIRRFRQLLDELDPEPGNE